MAKSDRDSVVPEIFVHDGPGALSFYKRAFGAEERERMMTPDGSKLLHGELEDRRSPAIRVRRVQPEGGDVPMSALARGTGARIMLEVDDADRTVERAVAAGAKVMMAVQDMFWGARYGKLLDPYGHEWGINQQVKHLTAAEETEQAQRYFSKK